MTPMATAGEVRMERAAANTLRIVVAVAAGATLLHPLAANGQAYPSKFIRVVTSAPGGSSDVVSRMVAQGMTDNMTQAVIVENRGSGVAVPYAAKSSPDGYTLLYYGSALWLAPLLNKDAGYDVLRDFVPISWTVRQPNILVVHPSLPVKSVKQLIALAKSRPGEMNYSCGGLGSSGMMAAELFKYMARLKIVRVNYKGQGPATNDAISGQVQLTFATIGSVAPHIKSGRLRALAVSSPHPSPHYPGLPTLAAAGLPGYEYEQKSGLLAPTGTPAPIIKQLHQAVIRALNTPKIRDRIFALGMENVGSTPEQYAAMIKSEIARMTPVIEHMGLAPK